MGYARFIGRVGALAVALGVGLAVAGTTGVAFAQTGSDSTSSTSSSPDPTSKPSSSHSLSTTASSIVHDVLSSIARVTGAEKTSTKGADSGTSTGRGKGFVQSSGGALISGGSGKNGLPSQTLLKTTIDAPSSAVTSSATATSGPDDQPPVSAGPTQDVTTLPQSFALASPMVVSTPDTPKPTTVVSGLVSSMLAWTGLNSDANKTPTAPVESPAFLGVLAWARRQFAQSISDGAGMTAQPMQTSLAMANTTATPTYQVTSIPIGTRPTGLGVSPDGTRVYVADRFTQEVWVVDTSTDTVVDKIPVGAGPNGVAVSADGTRAYVGMHGTNKVAVIDTATDKVIGTVKVGPGVTQVAVAPDGSRVYATNTSGRSVSVIDTATDTEIARVPVGGGPTGIVVSPDGSRVYVVNRASNTVSVLDTATNTVVDTVKVGSMPREIVLSPDGSQAFVTNDASHTVSVIDTATNAVVATVPVGKTNSPVGVGISPDGSLVYAANSNGTVTVIDTSTDTVVNTISTDTKTESGDHYLQVGPDGKIYVVYEYGKVLRVITPT